MVNNVTARELFVVVVCSMRSVSSFALLALAVALFLVLLADQGVLAAPQLGGNNNNNNRRPSRVGAKRCTSGPSYWCKDHANARECNTLDWCVQKGMLARQ